ncbi:peptidoglycan recognition protein [Streptomyces sp. NPDC047000]|uniref:peptidoglycan recognition protein family protein n=1 Tax=Streptomyces sp. NPDC047000 TaxID=3155474 RepID=UPI0033D9A008
MRGLIASSVGVACTAALALPLTAPASADPVAPAVPAVSAGERPAATGGGRARATTGGADTADAPGGADTAGVPGSTRSLPLPPAAYTRGRAGAAARGARLHRAGVRPFSLVGVVWDDPDAGLEGRVQVRTRTTGTGKWTGWQDLETHNEDHGADPGTSETARGRTHGSTAPLWVGDSDGVDARVVPAGTRSSGTAAVRLPAGLRLDLVDPGRENAPLGPVVRGRTGAAARRASAVSRAVLPALTRQQTDAEARTLHPGEGRAAGAPATRPYIGPRPRIVTRRGWGADEKVREEGVAYSRRIKAAFVHHTASGNTYRCSQAPSVIRSIHRYHVVSSGWRDIGYNFLVDRCGNVYEGRAGGVTEAVIGAHTRGFNTDSVGIAVIGTFSRSAPPAAAVRAVARLAAWKLGLYGADPRGSTYLTSVGGNLYRKGKNVRLKVISGHRDGFRTDCPGRLLYGKLGTARSSAARYQGR